MERTLSSWSTGFMKYVFPALWIGVFGYGTLQLWLAPEAMVFNGVRGGATRQDQWMFLIMLIVGTLFLAWACFPLKRVKLTERGFRISNYLEEIEVPFRSVSSVAQNRWLNMRPVVLHLRQDTQFGRRIVFLPARRRLFAVWREDELVSELRARLLQHSPPDLPPRAV